MYAIVASAFYCFQAARNQYQDVAATWNSTAVKQKQLT